LIYGQPTRLRPLLDSARRRRKQGNGVANPRIIRLTARDVVAAPDAHPSSTPPRQRLGDAAWTLDRIASISDLPPCARGSNAAETSAPRGETLRRTAQTSKRRRRRAAGRCRPPAYTYLPASRTRRPRPRRSLPQFAAGSQGRSR
jgi:hypothetical protein